MYMAEKNDELVKDYVCGMVKPKNLMKVQSVYKGKTYYFLSEGDKEMFNGYPEGWIPRDAEQSP